MSMAAIDRIGSLPDEILILILSFVPTKQAIATTILSKRWTNLWRHVPALDFSSTEVYNWQHIFRFNKFVNTVFHSREASSYSHSINSFILEIHCYNPQFLSCTIHQWVEDLVKLKVQYLKIYLHAPFDWKETKLPKMPMSILTCTTLVVLKLRWFKLTVVNDIPIRLTSLKTLHLEKIVFDQLRDFMMLLAGCPVLEDLQLSYIYMKDDPHHSFDNFESSSMLRKLNRADITMCYCYVPMKALSNLEFLRIQLSKDYHLYYDFPTFHNLTHLVLNYDWDIVVQVIKHCFKLQNLELYQKLQGRGLMHQYILNWDHPEFVPSCLSLNLKTCTMRDFAYAAQLRNHIMLARFILKNARVLETMKIWCSSKQSETESLLSPCPRGSATCQLSIYWQHI